MTPKATPVAQIQGGELLLHQQQHQQQNSFVPFLCGALTPTSSATPLQTPHGECLEIANTLPDLWVTKWVDYSSKYGIAYAFSDGTIGVYFNDSTKMVLTPDGNVFDYVTRRTQERNEERTTHTFDSYPDDLRKKVTLLKHFKSYLVNGPSEKREGATFGESTLPPPQQRIPVRFQAGEAPFIKKWTRNKHAIMFQLSNKIVQVIFFDKTEAVLSSKAQTCTYVDKKGNVSSYHLSNVLDVSHPELSKRLKYTKEILINLLGTRNVDLAGAAAQE